MKGSCFCGAVGVEWNDEQEVLGPITLCHCRNCRKSTGTFTTNFVLPTSAITVHGTPKIFCNPKTSSGLPAERFFCRECSSVLFTRGEAFPGFTVLKANILDVPEGVDEAEFWRKWAPTSEAFCRSRHEWLPSFEGTSAWETFPMGKDAKPWKKENDAEKETNSMAVEDNAAH